MTASTKGTHHDGSEAKWYEPNGEYDYFMREQVGFLTPHMGYTGGRCHDE